MTYLANAISGGCSLAFEKRLIITDRYALDAPHSYSIGGGKAVHQPPLTPEEEDQGWKLTLQKAPGPGLDTHVVD